jgi:hypothetical protein
LRRDKEVPTVSDELLVASDGAVRIVTINRPQSRNVIDDREFLGADKYEAIDVQGAET